MKNNDDSGCLAKNSVSLNNVSCKSYVLILNHFYIKLTNRYIATITN